jgi:hypothetical protein
VSKLLIQRLNQMKCSIILRKLLPERPREINAKKDQIYDFLKGDNYLKISNKYHNSNHTTQNL